MEERRRRPLWRPILSFSDLSSRRPDLEVDGGKGDGGGEGVEREEVEEEEVEGEEQGCRGRGFLNSNSLMSQKKCRLKYPSI